MNYGEELAYWYLRLNGFFPIANFVLHRGEQLQHNADVDVLAIRPPHVFELVGGQAQDWDPYLQAHLAMNGFIGLICEVKTGAFEEDRLFRREYVEYAAARLGLIQHQQLEQCLDELARTAVVATEPGGPEFAKLLVTAQPHEGNSYLNRSLAQLEDFLEDRVRRYPAEKYGARLFFGSPLFQHLIERVHRAVQQRRAA